jgi:hypothetical protein
LRRKNRSQNAEVRRENEECKMQDAKGARDSDCWILAFEFLGEA